MSEKYNYNTNLSESNRVRFNSVVERIPSDTENLLNIGVRGIELDETDFLHEYIIQNSTAETVAGLALREIDVQNLRERGYQVYQGDGQYLDLDEKFDVIIVGQVIRNFYDYGEFFRRVENHLTKDGKLIFTLANPHGIAEFRKAWSGNVPSVRHLSPENIKRILDISDTELKLADFELLPAKSGGLSEILWKLKMKRIGSPQYVGVIEREN